ncbi:uncharacterized protein LOC142767726 [Rhipicephalus microplus]|uniref:uncharacterized protein LOC142767726 n=1 Tax=Rhipicephalus microplus TaxID=6941 RepID=UPI003F6C2F96
MACGDNKTVLSTKASLKDSSKECGVCLTDLNEITGFFSGGTIDYASPCSATEQRACHIVRQLSLWNEVLSQTKMELRQSPRTRTGMTLMSVDNPYIVDHSLYMLHQAASLLHHLIKTHRCVTHFDIAMGRLNLYEQLLCDALCDNVSVETLKLQDTYKQKHGPHRNFCAVIPTLQNLRHFECDSDAECRPLFLETLTALLKTRSLESIRVPDLRMTREQAEAFLTALATCPSLGELSFNFGIVALASQECCAAFAVYLKSHTALTNVTFAGRDDVYSDGMRVVLRGVSENKTIARIEFRTALMQQDEYVEAVGDVLLRNATLRSVHVIPCPPHYDMGALYLHTWLTALVGNETLQEITLPFYIWSSPQWAQFFQALSRKRHLRKVLVVGETEDAVYLREVCDALRESGAEDKVVFGPFLGASCYQYAFHLVKSKCFRDVLVSDAHGVAKAPSLRKLLHQLCSLNHVPSLTVHVDPTTCKRSVTSALSDYVGTTTALKKLRLISLSFEHPNNESDLTWMEVFESFSRNRSLSELCVRVTSFVKVDSELLADVVKCSENIRSFGVSVRCWWHGTEFLSRLSQGIYNNYSLLSVQLPDYMNRDSFAVWDTTRRNFGLVASASQFLAGAECDRIIASSLERVYRHRALLQELAEVEDVSVDELAAKLRPQVRALEAMHDFMRIAGVVNVRVTCHDRDDGRAQLDDLNEHCWIAIRRYLTLDDIVDESAERDED